MCVCVQGTKRGRSGGTKRGGVNRPQKSIGWEERAEIICAVKGQRDRANRGWG